MSFLERHEVFILALIIASMILLAGGIGLYVSLKDHNVTAITATITATIGGLTGVKGATTFAATSSNSSFGSGSSSSPNNPNPTPIPYNLPPPPPPSAPTSHV